VILSVLDANSVFAWLCDHPRQATLAVFTGWLFAALSVARLCLRWRVWEADR
jgi:hypothetical protein